MNTAVTSLHICTVGCDIIAAGLSEDHVVPEVIDLHLNEVKYFISTGLVFDLQEKAQLVIRQSVLTTPIQ